MKTLATHQKIHGRVLLHKSNGFTTLKKIDTFINLLKIFLPSHLEGMRSSLFLYE